MTLSIIPYGPLHYYPVLNLIEREKRVHLHLDWHPVTSWLSVARAPSVLSYNAEGYLDGVVLFSPPTFGYVWLRLLAVRDGASSNVASSLLAEGKRLARQRDIQHIYALQTIPWLSAVVLANRFRLMDHIVHLQRQPASIAGIPKISLKVRHAQKGDLKPIERIDHLAFDMPWQMQHADFVAMLAIASAFTVALQGNQIVGYQISMHYDDHVHLTRLAVHPDARRQGAATSLVGQLITTFPQVPITVNTQRSNRHSQHFYQRLGFEKGRQRTPVWHRKVDE